jgi:APA family basic amino acid/polyamine antiporter
MVRGRRAGVRGRDGVAELAALRPRAGGEYVYLHAAFGRLAAFLTGWTSFVAGFTGAIAASAIVLTFYLDRLCQAPQTARRCSSCRFLAAAHGVASDVGGAVGDRVDGVDSYSRRRAGSYHGQRAAALKVSALLMFIALGFAIGAGSMTNLRVSAGPVAPFRGCWRWFR